MSKDFPMIDVGEEIRCEHFNGIYRELNRWRRMHGAGTVDVDGADGTNPPAIVGTGGGAPIPVMFTNSITAGSIAAPTTSAATLLVRTASAAGFTATGGTVITVYNPYSTAVAITTSKFGWVVLRDGVYYLLMLDC